MDTIELLTKFANPEVMQTLSLTDKLFAGLITTVLGMGITFVSLIVLQIVIGLSARLAKTGASEEEKAVLPRKTATVKEKKEPMNDEEIVAAITTALALQLKTSVSNIIIRNIERVEESSSAWQKAGIAEHMNNSL